MILEEFLQKEEGKTLEFKRDISSPLKILNTVVAFANTAGGHIIIGVEDKTKTPIGIQAPHLVEEKLSATISDAIFPLLAPNIEILNWKGLSFVIVEVYPESNKPYYIQSKGERKSTYVRVGSTNRLADDFMIEALKRSHLPTMFDEGIILHSSLSDLDLELAKGAFESQRTISSRDLITLGILSSDNRNNKHLTYGGALLFGKDHKRFLPDAWIHAGAFQGIHKVTIVDSQKIELPFYKSIDEAIAFFRKHLNVSLIIDDVKHREEWSIPRIALREALINAIVHCDYSLGGSPLSIAIFDDRIEIENPGMLPFGMTFEHLHQGISKIRNRVLARVFQELKIIEQWGSGIQRIKSACKEAGLREPLFEEIGYRFRVTLYREKSYKLQFSITEEKILKLLSHKEGLSTKDIADKIGLSTRQIRKYLNSLFEKGAIADVKRHNNDPERKYFLK